MIDLLKKEILFLFVVFLLSLIIRFLFFVFFLEEGKKSWVCTDSAEYNSIATNIAGGNGILKGDGDLNFRRLPGYPIFLAFCYKIFGSDIKNSLLVQVVLSSFIPIFIFFLSISFFPENLLIAKISSIYFALNLGLIIHSGLILSESLFILFFLLFLILFLKQIHFFFCQQKFSLDLNKIFLSGVLLGIISLIRPVGHYLMLVSLFFILCSNFKIKEKCKSSVAFFVGWFLVVVWWLLRNFILTGCIFFHTLPGIHFLIYSAAYIDADKQKCEYYQSKSKLLDKWNCQILETEKFEERKLTDIECCKLAEKIAFRYVIANPYLFVKHSLIHILKSSLGLHSTTLTFLSSGHWVNYDRNTTMWDKIKMILFPQNTNWFLKLLVYMELFFLISVYMGFLGFIVLSFFDSILFCLFLKSLIIIMLFLVLTLAYGCARLRLPIEPILLILSCYFYLLFLRKTRIKV